MSAYEERMKAKQESIRTSATPGDIPTPPATPNVANASGPIVDDFSRIPMSTPERKLEIDESQFPSHRLYWFLGGNVPRALRGGYEFVDETEIHLNQRGVANTKSLSGNADLGTRVSVIAGEGRDGQPEYLYLMKIKREWYDQDQKQLEAFNARIAESIRKKKPIIADGERSDDAQQRYVKTSDYSQPFQSKRRP